MATVPEQQTRNQIVATAGQTVFTYQFLILRQEDITVYLTPVGQSPDPLADILRLNIDYTVTGVGVSTGGTVVLTNPATAGDVVTEERDTIIKRETDFSVAGQFTADAINLEEDRDVMISQELETHLLQRGLTYEPTSILSPNRTENILPVLPPNTGTKISIWSKAAGGGLVALQLDSADDVNTLRSELASNSNGGDGALLVGYWDSVVGGTTVKAKLDEVTTLKDDLSNNTTNSSCGARLVGYNPNSNPVTVRKELETLGNSRTTPMDAVLNGSVYEATIPGTVFPFVSYDEEATYKIKFNAANPGAVDLNINSIGVKDLKDAAGNEFGANFIVAGSSGIVYYNSPADEFRMLSETAGSADAWASKTEVQNDSNIPKGVFLENFKDHPGIARAWAYLTVTGGTSVTVHDQYGITGIVNTGLATFRVDLLNTMASANYAVLTFEETNLIEGEVVIQNRTTTSFEIVMIAASVSSFVVFGKSA
jgi:hypothetical protein